MSDDYHFQYNMGRRMDGRMWFETFFVIALLLLAGAFAKYFR